MLFPEFLFNLSARDQQVTWLDPFLQGIDAPGVFTNREANIVVPDGRVLIMSSVQLSGIPGAGQNTLVQRIGILPPGLGNQIELKRSNVSGAADIRSEMDWQGEILVPPLWTIRGQVTFNAAVASNSAELNVCGVLIPVGNIQRV